MELHVAEAPPVANGSAKKEHSADNVEIIPYKNFADFAHRNFLGGIPSHFSRKDIKHQLLKMTGDSDKRSTIAIWKVLLKFMGDVTNYHSHTSSSKEPPKSSGSVMKRLYKHFGISNENDPNSANRNSVEDSVSKEFI